MHLTAKQQIQLCRHQEMETAAREKRGINPFHSPFNLIYADPPWKFKTFSPKGLGRSPERHYSTMSIDDICALQIEGRPVRDIAHRDAVLAMWVTNPHLANSFKVISSWGFTYKSAFA